MDNGIAKTARSELFAGTRPVVKPWWELFAAPAPSPVSMRIAMGSVLGAAAIALVAVAGLPMVAGGTAPPAWAQPSNVPDIELPSWNQIIDAPTWAQRLLPATLHETGLYADWKSARVSTDAKTFSPQYPLWSDGATKRRWIYLPGPIDTSQADWQLPVGTRIWKEFSFGARVETRFMIRARDGWKYATYAWTPDGRHAIRASFAGADSVRVSTSETHRIPSQADCVACHGNGKTPVLGFSALQLSPDRDPNALHREPAGEIDTPWLVERGFVPPVNAPRIAGSETQRAALGYLHGNCSGCHRAEGPLAGLGMTLAYDDALRTTVGVPSRYRAPALRVAPGDPAKSVLLARMKSRHDAAQMPPIATVLVDEEAIRLVADWIDQLAPQTN